MDTRWVQIPLENFKDRPIRKGPIVALAEETQIMFPRARKLWEVLRNPFELGYFTALNRQFTEKAWYLTITISVLSKGIDPDYRFWRERSGRGTSLTNRWE